MFILFVSNALASAQITNIKRHAIEQEIAQMQKTLPYAMRLCHLPS